MQIAYVWRLGVMAVLIAVVGGLSGGPTAAADDKVLLGGGAGIALNADTLCTLTTIGTDRAGELVGFTSAHCGGPDSQVAAEGGPVVGTVVATNDDLDYAVIKFDAAKVTPIPDFDGFPINGVGPDPGFAQGMCEQSRATGHSCSYVTVFRPTPDTFQAHGCRNPDDDYDGAPVTANDLLIGMVRDSGPLGGPPQICGFYVWRHLYYPPESQIVSINAIIDDANAKGGPGTGFVPVSA